MQQRDAAGDGVSSAGTASMTRRASSTASPVRAAMRSASASRLDVAAVEVAPVAAVAWKKSCTPALRRGRVVHMLRQRARQQFRRAPVEQHAAEIEHHVHARAVWPVSIRGRSVEPGRLAGGQARQRMVAAQRLAQLHAHWSKLLMPHSAPLVKTRCSYIAISAPSERGVS